MRSAICAATYVLHDTENSSPAAVTTAKSDCSASGLSAELVTPITVACFALISSSRTVSALFPDCDTATTSVEGVRSCE